jgi:uncharacterized protein (DUF2235 family)
LSGSKDAISGKQTAKEDEKSIDDKRTITDRFKKTFSRKENIKVHFLGAW